MNKYLFITQNDVGLRFKIELMSFNLIDAIELVLKSENCKLRNIIAFQLLEENENKLN